MNEDASIMVKDSTFKNNGENGSSKGSSGCILQDFKVDRCSRRGGQWVQVHPQGQNLNFWGIIYRGKL